MSRTLTADQLVMVADLFRTLGEPSRLQLLNALRSGECSVTELIGRTGLSQPNVSKHLQLLLQVGFVRRRKSGLATLYKLADNDITKLCDVMCDRLAADLASRRKVLEARR